LAALYTAFGRVAWAMVVPVTALAADEAYTVKRSDTIYSIARTYGIPPAVLAERNGLSKAFHVTVHAVKTHQQINIVGTRCPGAKFPTRSFLDSL